MALEKLSNNRAVKMLNAAAEGKYGVLGVVTYNMETIVAVIKAAEAKTIAGAALALPLGVQVLASIHRFRSPCLPQSYCTSYTTHGSRSGSRSNQAGSTDQR